MVFFWNRTVPLDGVALVPWALNPQGPWGALVPTVSSLQEYNHQEVTGLGSAHACYLCV